MPANRYQNVIILFWAASLVAGCSSSQASNSNSLPAASSPPFATTAPSAFDMTKYAFPETIDRTKRFLFYLHGKIIEDQGLPAISPDFGEYEYAAILEKLDSYGFVVISEQRAKNTDSLEYAKKI